VHRHELDIVLGRITPLAAIVSGSRPPPGIGFPGKPSCQRICIASNPPKSRKNKLTNRNWIPMILWSVEKMYFRMKLRSS